MEYLHDGADSFCFELFLNVFDTSKKVFGIEKTGRFEIDIRRKLGFD